MAKAQFRISNDLWRGRGSGIRVLLPLFASACLLLLAGQPSLAVAQSTDGPLDHVTLQLKWKHQFQFAGYYAAQAQNFYRNAGLDVNIVEAQEGVDPIGAVVDGQAEFGVGTSELLLWRNQGKPVVVLGVIFQHSPLVLLTTKQSGIDSLHGLIGKRVAIEKNSAELLAYLQDEGISTDKLQLLDHQFDPTALINGTMDAMSAYSSDEPFLLQNAGLDYQVFSPRAAGIDFYGDVLFTTEDEIKLHPQRVQSFLDASMRGWKYAFDHEDELIDYIYTHLTQRHSKEHLKFEAGQMRKLVMPDLIEPGYMYAGRWRYIAETYARVGLIPADFQVTDLLYKRETAPDLKPVFTGLIAALLIALSVGAVSLRFYRLNSQLRRQMDERHKAQAQLVESEARYRSLIELAPFPVVISRLTDNTLRYINPRAEAQLNLTPDEATGWPSLSLYDDPDDRQRLLEGLRESGQVTNFGVYLRGPNGRRFWGILAARLLDYEGYPSIFVTFNDLTDQKQMEEKLRQSEELYRSILHASPDDITIADLMGKIEIVSPIGLKMFGFESNDQVFGRSLTEFIAPEQRELAATVIADLASGKNDGIGEYLAVRDDGSTFHVEANAEIIRDADGQPLRLVMIVRDISERRRAEAQSFALAVEQERVKVLTGFIQNVSHEFRTPLSVINSSLYLMQRVGEDDKRRVHAAKASEQVTRINRLVDMLLTMSMLDSGAPMNLRPTRLNALVAEIALSLEGEARRQQLNLQVDRQDEMIVEVDAVYLGTALKHLLDNAMRYTAPGGSIDVQVYARGNSAVVQVTDTGVGISADAMPHIFERFWREDRAHSTPGFGLGLTLAQRIVVAHGGEIEVESADGRGSIFRVVLPLRQEDQVSEPLPVT